MGGQTFLSEGQISAKKIYLGPQSLQNLILGKISAKQNFFCPFWVLIVRIYGQNLNYAIVFLITKRSKGRKNKLEGHSLAMPGIDLPR